VLASEKMEELKTRKNYVPTGYGLFDRRVVHTTYLVVQPYAAIVSEFRLQCTPATWLRLTWRKWNLPSRSSDSNVLTQHKSTRTGQSE